uniref:aspartate-rich protein 1-like isoform X3 n=1 Tax=Macaca mulatta TaxID=9544 RepID=UPI0010A270BA|nr:aspartate-rich protein 1-like isoform X3 [Macaca mulatta]
MGCVLTCCIDSTCSWCRGKVAPCYESVIYEAVAAATSESTSVEPGKLDVGATEGHELQHIGNQKMPTGPPEDHLSLKSLPPSEEDNDDAQILPPPVLARSEDGLFLRCSPQCEDEDDDDDGDVDCDDDDDVQIRAWKGNDLTLESISDEETRPGLGRGPEDMRLMHRSKRRFSPSLMHTKVHRLHHVGQGGLKLQDLKSSACFDLPECLDSRNEPLCPAQHFTFQSLILFELLSVHGET